MPTTIEAIQTAGGVQEAYVLTHDASTYRASLGLILGTGLFGGTAGKNASMLRLQVPIDLVDKTIIEARLKIVARGNTPNITGGDLSQIRIGIGFEEADNAIVPAGGTDFILTVGSGLTTLIPWTPIIGTTVTSHQVLLSVDIKDALIDILSRPGWVANNYVGLYIVTTEPEPPFGWVYGWFTAREYDTDPITGSVVIPAAAYRPKLIIVYNDETPGSTDNYIEHTIDVQQFITAINLRQTVTHTLTVEQDISAVVVKVREVIHDIFVEQDIAYAKNPDVEVVSDVVVQQDISVTSVYNRSVESIVDVEQEIIVNGPRDKQIVHEIEVEQDIEYSRVYHRDVNHTLEVTQTISHSPNRRSVVHDLIVSQDISVQYIPNGHYVESSIDVEQDISVTVIYAARYVESVIDVQQMIVGYVVGSECERMDLTNRSVPELLATGTVILTSGVNTVTLPAPLFGNREELQVTRIQRKTLDGDLKTFVDSNWPRIRTFRFQFEGLNDTVYGAFNDFILLSLGLEIELEDHEGRTWNGFILTPESDTTEQSNDDCDYTVGFEFIGVLDE